MERRIPDVETAVRAWHTDDPERLVGRGHPVGDFLEAWAWRVLERGPDRLRVRAALPDRVKNPRGELFGGFTPTYVDFFSLHVLQTSRPEGAPRRWLSTASLRVEYFAPIVGPEFELSGRVVSRTGRTGFVENEFRDASGALCALGHATLIEHRD